MTGSVDSAVDIGAPTTGAVNAALESAHAVTNFGTVVALLCVVGDEPQATVVIDL